MDREQDGDEIVISGIGGYFPAAENFEELKEALLSEEPLLSSRWAEGQSGVSNKIGKIKNTQYFDNIFFGINSLQTRYMDPMQRILIERVYDAITDAGLNYHDIQGKNIAVLAGSSIGENDNLYCKSIISGYGITGQSRAMMSNRISYILNLKGMSCSYDSSWISGAEVLQIARDAIKNGYCESAIVTTANLAVNAGISWFYNDMGLLSPDGLTKSFDADANGYGRSDGIVAMFLQRKCNAKRVYATIVGAATHYDGFRSTPYHNVNQANLTSFLEECYRKWNVEPRNVDFIECYGCANKPIDEAELNAVDEVFCKNREGPLKIGSVKSNVGHAEPSAILISIAKVLVAMETGKIPATLNYSKPNPNIPGLLEGRLEVVTKNREWDGVYAAVNGFGISSSYAHCLLKINSHTPREPHDLATLVVVSSRTEEGIERILNTIKGQPKYSTEYLNLVQSAFSKSIPKHLYRGYAILNKSGEVERGAERYDGQKRQVWYVFSGMGSQWVGMGRDLMQLPVFATTIHRCCDILKPHGVDLMEIITSQDKKTFDNILHSFVGIAAVQIALTDVLKALGVVPDGIIGHSVGELGCAYADGCLTAEQMILSAYSRGKASNEVQLVKGMMAAVGLGYNKIKDQLPNTIEVACHNSATSSTISGPTEDMEVYVKELQDKGVFARLVNVANIAYHSRYIQPAGPLLLKYLREIIPTPIKRSDKWISTSIPENRWNSELAKTSSAEYHTNNLLNSVLFEEGSRHIPKDSIVIEIAPHGLLQAILKKSLKPGCIHIPLTKRDSKDGVNFLLNAIGRLYLAGVDVDLLAIYPKIDYPVGRGTSSLVPLVNWNHGDVWSTAHTDNLHALIKEKDTFLSLNNERFKYCRNNEIDNRIIVPVSAYLELIMKVFTTSKSLTYKDFVFENIRIRTPLELSKSSNIQIHVTVQKGTGRFQVSTETDTLITGMVRVPELNNDLWLQTYAVGESEEGLRLDAKDFYAELEHRGYNYQGPFRQVKDLTLFAHGALASLPGNQNWQTYVELAIQLMMFRAGEYYQDIKWPTIIDRINISFENVSSDHQDVPVKHHYATDNVVMKGVQISKITFETLPKLLRPVSFQVVDVMPLRNSICETIEKVINCTVNLILENYIEFSTNYIYISELGGTSPSLLGSVRKVMENYATLMYTLDTIVGDEIEVPSKIDPFLIVADGEINDAVLEKLGNANVSALVKTSKKLLNDSNVVIVATFTLNNKSYSLVRKSTNKSFKLVKYDGSSITSSDILDANTKWYNDLCVHLHNLESKQTLYLVSKCLPNEGIPLFLSAVRAHPDIKSVKYLFVLDEKLADIEGNKSFYEDLLRKNLVATVIRDGKAGACMQSSVDFNNITRNVQCLSNKVDDVVLEYISINKQKSDLDYDSSDLGNIDYVGKTKDNRNVMGIACVDKSNYKISPDLVLRWNVPGSWSLKAACAVPNAYIVAYHAIVQKIDLNCNESILLDMDYGDILLAAINIVTSLGCTFYVTVDNSSQKDAIVKDFPKLNRDNIVLSKDTFFESQLMNATCGVGVHAVISDRHFGQLQSRARCMNIFGRIVMLRRFNLKRENEVGLGMFLKFIKLTSIIPENLFTLRDDDKQQLHQLVQKGIDDNVVKPASAKKVIVRTAGAVQMDDLNGGGKALCNSNGSYVIFGESQQMVLALAQWLAFRGAKKIYMIIETSSNEVHLRRRVNLLISRHNVEVKHIFSRVLCKTDADKVISSLYSEGSILAVFNLGSYAMRAEHLLDALRAIAPRAPFINFHTAATLICLKNYEAGYPTFNIEFETSLNFQDVIDRLDDLISLRNKHVAIKNMEPIDSENEQNLYRNSVLVLPSSPRELIQMAIDCLEEPQLLQMFSFGPSNIRELPPIILVPGFSSWKYINDFAIKADYPVFCTVLPNRYVPLKQLAEFFAKKIRAALEGGPYNIVGISCGGILSIEIAKHLQRWGKTQVTLIDAAPDTTQATLGYLGQGKSQEVNLLYRIFGIYDPETLKKIADQDGFDSRFETSCNFCGIAQEERSLIKETILVLRNYLNEFIEYKSDGNLVEGEVHLVRPTGASKFSNCGLNKYFKEFPQISLTSGDHLSILRSDDLVDLINTNVAMI